MAPIVVGVTLGHQRRMGFITAQGPPRLQTASLWCFWIKSHVWSTVWLASKACHFGIWQKLHHHLLYVLHFPIITQHWRVWRVERKRGNKIRNCSVFWRTFIRVFRVVSSCSFFLFFFLNQLTAFKFLLPRKQAGTGAGWKAFCFSFCTVNM